MKRRQQVTVGLMALLLTACSSGVAINAGNRIPEPPILIGGPIAPVAFTWDLLAPKDGIVLGGPVTLQWQASNLTGTLRFALAGPGLTTPITLDLAADQGMGTWQLPVLKPGQFTLTVTALGPDGTPLGDPVERQVMVPALPIIDQLKPAPARGAPMEVVGSHFGTDEGTVTVGGKAARVLLWGPTSVVVVVPADVPAGPQTITLTTAGNEPTSLEADVAFSSPGGGGGGGDGGGAPPAGGGGGADTTAPVVTILNPAAASTLAGNVLINASLTDVGGIQSAVCTIRDAGNAVVAGFPVTDATAPYDFTWNTATVADGAYTIAVTGTDTAANTATATVTVTVNNAAPDTTPPVITITTPAADNTVMRGGIAIQATATDTSGIASATYTVLDNVTSAVAVAATAVATPVSVVWNSATAVSAVYKIRVSATDGNGNAAQADRLVVIDNTAPTIAFAAPTPANNATLGASTTIAVTPADNHGLATVTLTIKRLSDSGIVVPATTLTGPGYSHVWDSSALPPDNYQVSVTATDSFGLATTVLRNFVQPAPGNPTDLNGTIGP